MNSDLTRVLKDKRVFLALYFISLVLFKKIFKTSLSDMWDRSTYWANKIKSNKIFS